MNRNRKILISSLLAMGGPIYVAIFYSLEMALLLLGGIILFAYVLRKPYRGTILTVFLSCLGTLSLYRIGRIHIKAYQVVLLILVAVLVIYSLKNREKILVPDNFGPVLIVFAISLLLSVLNCTYPAIFIKQSVLLILYILFMFVIINTVKNEQVLNSLVKVIVLSAYIACLYSILAILKVIPGGLAKLTYHFARPTSFFAEPNEFGLFLVFTFGFVFSLLLASKKIALWVIFVLIIANVIPNMSRGSWLGMLASICTILYFTHAKGLYKVNVIKGTFMLLAILGIVIASLSMMSKIIPTKYKSNIEKIVSERARSLFSTSDPTRDIRYQNNLTALAAFGEHPFVGCGLGNAFVILEKKYDNRDVSLTEIPPIVVATSSNFASDLAVETGLFGLGSFLLFIYLVIKQGLRSIKSIKDQPTMIVIIGAFASFVGIIVNGLTYAMHLLPFFWITAGILSVRITEEEV
ncbi:MAG: O-antigen ligase family protein [Elusimicrobia bacterium]|nr:O-antigen ligase family protein [Elusimicrobiota bacterium]